MRRQFVIRVWVRAGDGWRRHDVESVGELEAAKVRARGIRDDFAANGVQDTIVVVVCPDGELWACGASRLLPRTVH